MHAARDDALEAPAGRVSRERGSSFRLRALLGCDSGDHQHAAFPSHSIMTDSDTPTETTALLSNRPLPAPEHPPLPLVEPVILRVLSKGIASCTLSDFCPTPLKSPAEELAFSLIVLLYARNDANYKKGSRQDVLEHWHVEQQQVQDLQSLEQRVISLWNTFLSQCHSDDAVEVALWTSFPYEKPGYYSKRGAYPVTFLLASHSYTAV